MKIKLYKDGNFEKFTNYRKAVVISAIIASIFYIFADAVTSRFYAFYTEIQGEDVGVLLSLAEREQVILLGIVCGLAFIGMIYILAKPLFVLSDNKLTYYDGLFSKHTYRTDEVKSIQVSSDKESVTITIRNIGGLANTIDMRATTQLGDKIVEFLKENSTIEVELLD